MPTLKEIGVDVSMSTPYGIGGPKGMSPAIVATLHDALKKGMEDPTFIDTMTQLDVKNHSTSVAPTIAPS